MTALSISALAAAATSTIVSTPSGAILRTSADDVLLSVVDDVVGAGRGSQVAFSGLLTVVMTNASDQRASWIAALPTAPAPPETSTVRPCSVPGPSRSGPPRSRSASGAR